MDIVDDIGVSKLSPKVFFSKVNYSFKRHHIIIIIRKCHMDRIE